jgi:hypothetical protein
MGGADYAEYFEGDPSLPIGATVVVENGRVRAANADEDPIGVVRHKHAKATIIGDANEEHWHGKYLLNEHGAYVYHNGYHVISNAYVPTLPYVPRSQRPEWKLIGLLGKVQVLPTSVKGSRWVFLKKYNDLYDLWLVR